MKPQPLHDSYLGLKLPGEIKSALVAEAERRGVTVSDIARAVLGDYLNEHGPTRTRENLRKKRAATATRIAVRRDRRPVIRTHRERP